MIDLFKTNGSSPPVRRPSRADQRPAMPSANYRVTEVRFTVLREATERLHRRRLDSPQAVAELVRQLIPDDAREHFGVVLLDAKLQLVAWHHVSTGTLSASLVHPREVFGPAFRLLGVSSVALAHNHPSGDPTPSTEDIKLTRQLVEAARLLDIRVQDHVILGDGTAAYVSLGERGLL
jgi:DNA repair protein RadC